MSDEKITLKYKWRQTWPDRPDDYVGRDPDNLDEFGKPSTIGCFYLSHIPGGMGWLWFVHWSPPGGGRILPKGVENTAREAAKAIEDNYDWLRSLVAKKP